MNKEQAEAEAVEKNKAMTAHDVYQVIENTTAFYKVWVEEYTFQSLRIDAMCVDISERKINGFEIKVSRADFKQDKKWQLYGSFCSSLSIVCLPGLIQPGEIDKPFGLIWAGNVAEKKYHWSRNEPEEWEVIKKFHHKKRPKPLADTNMFNWLFTYMRVIEYELPRMNGEINNLRMRLQDALKRKQP